MNYPTGDSLLAITTGTMPPSKEAVLFALLCGLLLGLLPSLLDVVVEHVRTKLGIPDETEARYFVTRIGVSMAFFALYAAALQLFGPSFEQRREFFDRQIAELGYEQFFSLSLLGTAVVLPVVFLRASSFRHFASSSING